MISRGIVVVLLAAALSPAAWAGDPWKDKSYADWDLADTTKILTRSPWVKDAYVTAPWVQGQPMTIYPMLGGCGGRMDPAEVPPSANLGPSFQSMIIYRVTWTSSRTYREAKARRAVLCKEMTQDEADGYLEQSGADDYLVYVEAPDMTPFEGSDEAAIQKNTVLSGKKSGLKLSPSSVDLREVSGGRILGVLYHFPKTTEDGKPAVAAGEKELTLDYKSGKTEVKVKFQPDRMMRGDAQDL
jgi:hypothetical protein